MSRWLGRFRVLGQALLELLRAEMEALAADLRRSAAHLRGGVVLLLAALFVAFWTLGGLVYLAVEVLALWLPRWGAVLTVCGVLAVLTIALVAAARARLRRIEKPKDTVRRHLESHIGWLESELLPGEGLTGGDDRREGD